MRQQVQIGLFALALFLGASLLVSAQVGLWVSTASGLTTSGKVAMTSSAADALFVTGGVQTTGVVTSSRNENAISRNTFSNFNAGNGAGVVIDLNNDGGAILELGVISSTFPGLENKSIIIATGAGGLSINANHASGSILYNSGASSTGHTFSGKWINSNTSQPGFLAYNSADDAGIGASTVTVDFDSEIYDQTSSFAADTFTAPVTGTYMLCAAVKHEAVQIDAFVTLKTSNRDYEIGVVATELQSFPVDKCVHADMDVGDTAFVQDVFSSTPNTIDGGASPLVTHFSGRLVP